MKKINCATTTLEEIIGAMDIREFGFVAQALLAIIFFRFGGKIKSVKATGHPDISLYYQRKNWKIEVEVMGNDQDKHIIRKEDLVATKPVSQDDIGYLAILDTHPPPRWCMLRTDKIFKDGEKAYRLFELRVQSDKAISEECTGELYNIVSESEHKETIMRERYSGLVQILKQENNDILFE